MKYFVTTNHLELNGAILPLKIKIFFTFLNDDYRGLVGRECDSFLN